MKKYSLKNLIPLLLFFTLISPKGLFAEGIDFSVGPSAQFTEYQNGQGTILVTGSISGPSLVPTSLVLSYAALTTAPTGTFTGPWQGNASVGADLNFSFEINQSFAADTDYYIVLNVAGQSSTDGLLTYQESLTLSSPPGNISSVVANGPGQIELNLINPIGGVDVNTGIHSIPQFFQKLITLIIKIAIPFTAIVLVYCGLLFVTARGDTAQLEKARNAFTFAIIGGLVLLSSWIIAEAIRDALTSLAYVF